MVQTNEIISQYNLESHVAYNSNSKNKSKLGWLDDTLNAWIEINKDLINHSPNDAAYLYDEQTNVSLLSSAAYKAGLLSLAEYSSLKSRDTTNREYKGRTDLYISEKNKGKKHAIIEAKQIFIGTKENIYERIANTLVEESKSSKNSDLHIDKKISCVFVIPRFKKLKTAEALSDKCKKIIIDIGIHHGAVAWYTPKYNISTGKNISRANEDNPYFFTGIFLILKPVKMQS